MRRFIGSFSGATSVRWLTEASTTAWDFPSGSVSESSACVTGLTHSDWYLCNKAGPYNHFCMSNFAKGILGVTKSAGFDLPSIWCHCCGSACCLIRLISWPQTHETFDSHCWFTSTQFQSLTRNIFEWQATRALVSTIRTLWQRELQPAIQVVAKCTFSAVPPYSYTWWVAHELGHICLHNISNCSSHNPEHWHQTNDEVKWLHHRKLVA